MMEAIDLKKMMKKSITIVLLFVLVFTSMDLSFISAANDAKNEDNKVYLIKYKDIEGGKKSLKEKKKDHKLFKHMPVVKVKLNENELSALVQDPNVEYIEEDGTVSVLDIEQDAAPTMDEEAQLDSSGQEPVEEHTVKVAIIDTGAWQGLSVAGGASFVGDRTSYKDDHGHGTFVSDLFQKSAPNASLYAIKALDQNGVGSYSQVIEALEWAIDNDINIVNMSFGGKTYSLALAEAVALAEEKGILLFAAAGNDSSTEIAYPAKFNSVVAVGSVEENFEHAVWSNTGIELEFVAFGSHISGKDKDGNPITMTGTSASVSQVAAIAALYMESFPSLGVLSIRELLRTSALPLGPTELYGYGYAQFRVVDEQVEESEETEKPEGQSESEEAGSEDTISDPEHAPTAPELSENIDLLGEQRLQAERDRISLERRLQAERQQIEEGKALLSASDVAEEFGLSLEWVESRLAEGFTVQELMEALISKQETATTQASARSFATVELPARKVPVNVSLQAESEVVSNVGSHIQPEQTNYLQDESLNNSEERSEAIDANERTNSMLAASTPEAPVIKPVEKISEAPYTVGLHGENVSLLSGALSVSATDLVLPGRNGLSFALQRTYNSSNAQFEQPDVGSSASYVYYFDASQTNETRSEYYDLTRSYTAYLKKYSCSTGQLLWYGSDQGKSVSGGTYTKMQALDTAKANPPSLPSETVHACNTKEPDRKYVKEYTFSVNVVNTRFSNWSGQTTSGSFGPFSSYTDASNARSAVASGQYNSSGRGGSYSGGYYEYRTTYSNVGSVNSQVTSYTNYNTTSPDLAEKKFPIGKGWSWNIPYIKTESGKRYVSLPDGSVYEVSGTTLKNYPWSDLSVTNDTSVTYGGRTSSLALKSVYGTNHYFDASGNLIQTKDSYGNTISFGYTNVSPYGVVLTSVTDAANNSINIQYSPTQVVLSLGDKTVTYAKTTVNGKEMLGQVTDPMGRVTTYQYEVKAAKFNLLGSSPTYNNPYALLTGVVHPTGVKSAYTYEVNPVTRYIGSNQVNQVYRMAERKDIVTYSDLSLEEFNRSSVVYSSDMGSSYTADTTFFTTLFDGLLETKMVYFKDYVNSTVGNVYYNTQVVQNDGEVERITDLTYNQQKYRTNPISSSTYYRNIATGATSTPITSSQVFDDYQNVVSETSPLGVTSTYTFDATTRRLKTSTVPTNIGQSLYTEVVSRNGAGDITEMIMKDSGSGGTILSHVQYSYDNYGNITIIRNKEVDRDLVTQIEYGSVYQYAYPTKITRPYTDADGNTHSQVIQASYDKTTGLLLSYIDGNQNTTAYAYDKLNRLIKMTNPDNSTIRIAINDALNEVEETDEVNRVSYSRWNPLGWLTESGIEVNAVRKAKSKTGYDSYGRALWNEDSYGNRTVRGYDDWGRAISVTLPDTAESTVSYDDILRIVVSTNAEGEKARQSLDLLGRPIKHEIWRDGSYQTQWTRTYNYRGDVLSNQDGKNYLTSYTYNPLGQLKTVTAADQETHSYAYNRSGQLTNMTYPDQSIAVKAYDELGRLIRAIDPLQKSEIYHYDANGNQTLYVDKKGQTFTFLYNNRNWLMSKQGPTETISYTYNADGARATMTDNGGETTSYTYDPQTGELSGIAYPDGKTISYEYDEAGRRMEMTTPFEDSVRYSYNEVHQLTDVYWNDEVQASYSYDLAGRLREQLQGNGVKSRFDFTDGLFSNLMHIDSEGNVLNTYSYGYDIGGNIVTRSEMTGNTTDEHHFTYDSMHRISTSTLHQEIYSYDTRGNRKTLESEANVGFDDMLGEYVYDEWDRLTKVTKPDGTIAAYKYNGDNLLTERTENGETTRYYYDGGNIIAEALVDENGTVSEKASYLYGAGLIMREDAAGNDGYYLRNGHGDIVEIRDVAGLLLNQYQYDLWGNTLSAIETIDNPFRYSGEYWDDSVKLQYLRARWYQPTMGRFINEDTYEGKLNNPLSLNLYTYVENNPLIYVDPTGHAKSGDINLPESVRNQILPYTEAWHIAADMLKSLDRSSQYYHMNVSLLKNFQAVLEAQADLIRIGYYQTLINPTQAEINAAKQAGYLFGQTVDLGAGWSYRKDPGDERTGTKDHIHVNGPNGKHWSQNEDGTIHDKGKNSPGEPPNWVKKDLKKKGRWDWDENKAKVNPDYFDPNNHHIFPENPNNPSVPAVPVFPRIIII